MTVKKISSKSADRNFYLILLAVSALLVFIALSSIMGIYGKHIIVEVMFFAYLGTAWNLMSGYTGRVSLGHSAYTAVGAYAAVILFKNFNLSPWIGMFAGALLSMGLMFLIAFPSFRFGLKGPYFTLASIAVMEIVRYLLTSMRSITNGSLGMSLPYRKNKLTMFQFDAKEPYIIIILIFWLAVIFLLKKQERRRYYLEAIREDDDAAAALGISVNKNLIITALTSAFFVSIGGTFYAQYYRYIDPMTVAGPELALQMALIAIVGGSGTIFGPTIGAVILIPLSDFLSTNLGSRLSGLHLFIYGVLLVLVILYLPKGVVSIPGLIREKRAAREARKRSTEKINESESDS